MPALASTTEEIGLESTRLTLQVDHPRSDTWWPPQVETGS